MKTSFSIVIVTWNALGHLQRFLPSVAKTDYPDFEIVIADNASEDHSSEWIKSWFPGIKVVTFDKNYGYSGGNNRAVKYTQGDVLIFLNNDAEVDPGWLSELDKAFTRKGAGIVQPKIKSAENPEYFEYAGAAGGMIDWLGYPFCRGRLFNNVEKDTGRYDRRSSIFWASGAALAIKKDLFLESGGFDEDFEFHMEEIDLCWRCHKKGTTVLYEPASVVYHLGGGSLPMGSPRKVFYNYRNSLLMLTKNLDHGLIPKLLLRLFLDGIAGFRSLLQGKPAETAAIVKAHFAFYGRLWSVLKKRKDIQKTSTAPTPVHLVYNRLVIFEYFLKGKRTFGELTQSGWSDEP